MQSSKETRILNTVCVCLVLLAGFCRVVIRHFGIFSYNVLICALFTAASFLWISKLQKRLLQSSVRRNLIAVAFLILFWMVLRTMKYEFLPEYHFTCRFAWYLYYLPMIFIPLLMFFSVLQIGRPQARPISKWWSLLYLPAALLLLLVLTNDIHQLAFRFLREPAFWGDTDFIRGPVYYLVYAWMSVLFLTILVIAFMRCAVPANRKRIWIPAVPLLIGAVYTLGVILGPEETVTGFLTVPEMGCFLFASFIESLICVHLFPSNDRYGEFFRRSSIGAGIMDMHGQICYESARSRKVSPEQVRTALEETVPLDDGNTALRSHTIRGGYGYWLRDLSQIQTLNRKLSELGDVVEEENAMLRAENKMAEDRTRIRQQNLLYDSIAKDAQNQLDRILEVIENPPEDEACFEHAMKYACILNAYVKRRSNLLLSHPENLISCSELRLAMAESLEYVRLYGTLATGGYRTEGRLPGQQILMAYEIFEAVLEASIPGADAVLVNLKADQDGLTLRMTVNAPGNAFSPDPWKERIASCGGSLQVESEQETMYITLVMTAGGENHDTI